MAPTPKPAVLQTHLDPATGKIINHFGERSVFTVYVKRHNGRKITIHMGSGAQIREVLEFYHGYKIYQNDRKYLYHRLNDEALDKETKVLMENGEGKTPKPLNPGRSTINYQHGEMSAIKHVPKSIIKGLDDLIRKHYVINSQVMTKSRLIMILLAEVLEMEEEERLKFLARGDLLLERHKLNCGGISPERIQKQNAHIEEVGEDLL